MRAVGGEIRGCIKVGEDGAGGGRGRDLAGSVMWGIQNRSDVTV